MALAYRATAEQQHQLLTACLAALETVDKRLIAFTDPATAAGIDTLIKKIHDAETPHALDRRFSDWGEAWHADIPVTYEEDDHISARQAAPLLGISHETLGKLRVDGRIKGQWDPDLGTRGGYRYRVGDIWELATKLRGRNWRTKDRIDSINDSGRSDPK